MQEEISAQAHSTFQLLLTSCWHHSLRVFLHLCPTQTHGPHFPAHCRLFLCQAASLIPPAFTSGAIELLRALRSFSFLRKKDLTCVVLFLFKQFLIRPQKKDRGGQLGKGDACRTWHDESKTPFLRLCQQVIGLCWGSDTASGQLLKEVCPARGRLQY